MTTTASRTADAVPTTTAPAPVPRGAVPASGPATVLALLMVALAVVLGHDAVVSAGWLAGGPWVRPVLQRLDGAHAQGWMVAVGAVLVLLGVWWLVAAVRPRPRRAYLLGDRGAWLAPVDVARLARAAAQSADGVVSARASAGRRTVALRVSSTVADGAASRADLRDAVTSRLEDLDPAPRVRVRARTTGGTP